MFSFTPFPILETERLLLRNLTLEDSLDVFAMRADLRTHRYTDTKPDQTVSETENYIRKMARGIEEGKWILWAMEDRESNTVIGTIGIWNFDAVQNTAELSYSLSPQFQGRGLMTEALLSVISYGLDSLRLGALIAFTEEDNLPSKKLLEKCGFQVVRRVDDPGVNNDRVYHMIEYKLENELDLYIVDAFTDRVFGGNQAGVVLLRKDQSYPEDPLMQKIAAELKHSETAFIRRISPDAFQLRYFTPEGEVDLCGHATISTFTVLRQEKTISAGDYTAKTRAGDLRVLAEPDKIWLQMPRAKRMEPLPQKISDRVYAAFRLDPSAQPVNLAPCIADAGLPDILLPVNGKAALDRAEMNREEIARISKEMRVVGVHLYYCPPDSDITADCRNFAPLYGIDEECATGTSNASLTYCLDQKGLIQRDRVNTFRQGESMGKPCEIFSRIDKNGTVFIGGNAVISVKGRLFL